MSCGLEPQWPSSAFYRQPISALIPSDRHVKAINNPPLYGISTKDYNSNRQTMGWPVETTYQHFYGAKDRPIATYCLPSTSCTAPCCPRAAPECSATPHNCTGTTHRYKNNNIRGCDLFIPRGGDPIYHLEEPTPIPLLDKHCRDAKYHINDPLGVINSCEFKQYNNISDSTKPKHVFTPNYRYKDWIRRPMTEIENNMNCDDSLICRVPDPPTKYFDFYHQVRMNRCKQPVRGQKLYMSCRVLPIPINHQIPNDCYQHQYL